MIDFPEELKPTINQVVDAANSGEKSPKGIEKLHDWLEENYLQTVFDNFEMVVFLDALDGLCDDQELRNSQGYNENEFPEITDELRYQFLLDKLKQRLFNDTDIAFHSIELSGANNTKAFLGCLVQAAGMHGDFFNWIGIFPTEEGFEQYFKKNGVLLDTEGIDKLKPADVLKYWIKEK